MAPATLFRTGFHFFRMVCLCNTRVIDAHRYELEYLETRRPRIRSGGEFLRPQTAIGIARKCRI